MRCNHIQGRTSAVGAAAFLEMDRNKMNCVNSTDDKNRHGINSMFRFTKRKRDAEVVTVKQFNDLPLYISSCF